MAITEDLAVLVSRARAGESEALEKLIVHYRRRIAGFVFLVVGADTAVEDLCQTIFVKMIVSLRKLKDLERFESWLFRVARNVCFDHLRRERLRRFFVPFERKHEQVAAPAPLCERDTEVFRKALAMLPPKQRELILLLQNGDWSYEELARITGGSLSAVKSRLFRARADLKRRMADEV